MTNLGELYVKLKISMNGVSWYYFHLRMMLDGEEIADQSCKFQALFSNHFFSRELPSTIGCFLPSHGLGSLAMPLNARGVHRPSWVGFNYFFQPNSTYSACKNSNLIEPTNSSNSIKLKVFDLGLCWIRLIGLILFFYFY